MNESSAASTAICHNANCAVAVDGMCAEMLDPVESCPFYNLGVEEEADDPDDPDESDLDIEPAHAYNTVSLPSGDTLDVEGVDEFLRQKPITLVAMVGERESGKTTLIGALYDQFLRGVFAGYSFAGSQTIVAFEQRLHYTRAASGRVRPDTPRTSLAEGVRFFHLALVCRNAPALRYDLMFSDRAGETYREVRDRPDTARDLVEIRKASTVALLLDGGRLAEPADRSGAMESVRQTLRALVESGTVSERSILQVITTKHDVLAVKLAQPSLTARLEEFRERLQADFAEKLGHLSFWDVAARPVGRELPPAWGVDALLRSWVDPPAIVKLPITPSDIHPESEFDLLMQRTPMEVSE